MFSLSDLYNHYRTVQLMYCSVFTRLPICPTLMLESTADRQRSQLGRITAQRSKQEITIYHTRGSVDYALAAVTADGDDGNQLVVKNTT